MVSIELKGSTTWEAWDVTDRFYRVSVGLAVRVGFLGRCLKWAGKTK